MGPVTISHIKAVYYPILAVVGIPVNLLSIAVFSLGKCGLSRCVTLYLLAMATADLCVVVVEVLLGRVNASYFPVTFLSLTPVCSLRFMLFVSVTDTSVYLTTLFTIDRCVAICCQRLKPTYCTRRVAWRLIAGSALTCCLKSIPWYFVFEPVSVVGSVPLYCTERAVFFTSPAWAAFIRFEPVFSPIVPICVILVANALTARHILAAGRARRRLRALGKAGEERDPQAESRRRSLVLLFTISGIFVLLWTTMVVYFLNWQIRTYTSGSSGETDAIYILQETGFMLLLANTCTNTGVYALTQSKFRQQLVSWARLPIDRIQTCFKINSPVAPHNNKQ